MMWFAYTMYGIIPIVIFLFVPVETVPTGIGNSNG